MAVAVVQAIRYNEKHRNSLLRDLNSERFEDENLCDATLQVDGKSFSIHKCIVGKVSIYFRKLFKVQMMEKYDLFANMEGFTSELMESILNYIYTGSVDINDENVLDLVAASEYLLMDDLKLFCRDHFVKNVTSMNCLSYYKFGNARKWMLLKKKAGDVFVKNFELVSKQKEFALLEKDDLKYLLSRVDQDVSTFRVLNVFEGISSWMKHDVESRKQFFLELMNLVKFHRLSSESLRTMIKEDLMKEIPEVMNLLKEEMEWKQHLDAEAASHKKGFVVIEGKSWQVFDVVSETFAKLPDLPKPPAGSCIVVYQDYLYVIGGAQGDLKLILRLKLHKQQAVWEDAGQTLEDRNAASAVVHDDAIFISGGKDHHTGVKSVETYRQIGSEVQQTLIQPMNHARYGHVMTKCCDLIYCFGGNTEVLTEIYSNETWKVGDKQRRLASCVAVAVNCEIYVINITPRCKQCSLDSYNVERNEWKTARECPFPYATFSATHKEGKIYTYGMCRSGGQVFAEYDILHDTWKMLLATELQTSAVFYASI